MGVHHCPESARPWVFEAMIYCPSRYLMSDDVSCRLPQPCVHGGILANKCGEAPLHTTHSLIEPHTRDPGKVLLLVFLLGYTSVTTVEPPILHNSENYFTV